MESGAILVVQRSPPAVQPRRASALPRGRGVPLPTRSGRRGGVLRVPPARGAARDAREAVHAPSPSCSARGISALAAFRWYKTGTLRGRGLPMQLVEVSRPRVRGVSAGREAGAGGGFGDTGGRQRGLKTWERGLYLRGPESALHTPRRVYRLRSVRAGVSGEGDLHRGRNPGAVEAVHRAQQTVLRRQPQGAGLYHEDVKGAGGRCPWHGAGWRCCLTIIYVEQPSDYYGVIIGDQNGRQ